MKLKCLVTFLFFGFTICSQGQNYDSLVKPGKKWYYNILHGGENITWRAGDISIVNETGSFNGKIYFKLKKSANMVSNDSLWIREEDKRVYILNLQDTIFKRKEILAYDFNLVAGDTFRFITRLKYKDSLVNARIIVKNTYIKNKRKCIDFKGGNIFDNNFNGNDFGVYKNQIFNWTEGIGGEQLLIYPFDSWSFTGGSEVVTYVSCLFDNLIQILPETGNCDSLLGLRKTENISVKVYPNPAQNLYYIKTPNSNLYKIQTSNSLGEKLDHFELEGKTEYKIPCNYASGIYFLHISNKTDEYYLKLLIE